MLTQLGVSHLVLNPVEYPTDVKTNARRSDLGGVQIIGFKRFCDGDQQACSVKAFSKFVIEALACFEKFSQPNVEFILLHFDPPRIRNR